MEILELPPLKREIEWPTVTLAVGHLRTMAHSHFFPPSICRGGRLTALGAWIVTWQLNLQHETIHGHPTRNRRVNEAIGCWPLSLWLPYSIYRSTHLAHHRDENLTDPFEDPESYYWTASGWGGLGPVWRALAYARTTLLGRVTLGPSLFDRRASSVISCVTRGAANAARGAVLARHLLLRAGADLVDRHLPHAALDLFRVPSSILAQASPWCAPSPSIAPCPRRRVAPRSSKTPGSLGRFSCSTTCMRCTTCGIGCPGIRFRNSIGSTGRR